MTINDQQKVEILVGVLSFSTGFLLTHTIRQHLALKKMQKQAQNAGSAFELGSQLITNMREHLPPDYELPEQLALDFQSLAILMHNDL